MIEALLFGFSVAFLLSYLSMGRIIAYLKSHGITGKDVNKPDKPEIPEMGGLGVSFIIILLLLFMGVTNTTFGVDRAMILAVASSLSIIALIGVIDDLYSIPQAIKAVLPMLAGIPLVVVMTSTIIHIPLLGNIDFGIFYFAIVFLSLAVASNLTNMLAGFNGMEYGMALPIFGGSLIVGVLLNIPIVILLSGIMLGSCLVGFKFGFPVAKMFIGDVGTLTIGGMIAIIILVGHIEAFAVVFIPYIIDFYIKAKNGFPSRGWSGTYRDGILHCDDAPKGFAQTVMKWANGISEIKLVMWFIFFETFFVCMAYVAVMMCQ